MEYLTGKIAKVYRNCPKRDGWCGMFIDTPYGNASMTGMLHPSMMDADLYSGMRFAACGEWTVDNRGNDCFHAETIIQNRANFSKQEFQKVGISGIEAGNRLTEHSFTAFPTYESVRKTVLKCKDRLVPALVEGDSEYLKKCGLNDDQVKTLIQIGQNFSPEAKLIYWFPFLGSPKKKKLREEILDRFGSLYLLKKDPYVVWRDYKSDFKISFQDVDDAAILRMGVRPDAEIRVQAVLSWVFTQLKSGRITNSVLRDISYQYMHSAFPTGLNSGHVYLDVDTQPGTESYLLTWSIYAVSWWCYLHGGGSVSPDEVRCMIEKLPDWEICDDYGKKTLYRKTDLVGEKLIASELLHTKQNARMAGDPDEVRDLIREFEDEQQMQFDDDQRNAILNSICYGVSILTGRPGCGKTATVSCMVYVWTSLTGKIPILAASTGCAALRLEKSAQKGYALVEGHTLAYYAVAPYKCETFDTLVIIEETSMADLSVMYQFLSKTQGADKKHIVFIGDVDQLPSVGAGQVFKDLIDSDVFPITRLQHCYRTDIKLISDNAQKVLEGKPLSSLKFDPDSFMFYFHKQDDISFQDDVVKLYLGAIQSGLSDKDVTVLTPMKKGVIGVEELNFVIQNHLNKERPVSQGCADLIYPGEPIPFLSYGRQKIRVGDRVIYTKNQMDLVYKKKVKRGKKISEEKGMGLLNGDLGHITKAYVSPDEKVRSSTVEFTCDDGRVFVLEEELLDYVDLGYAMTVHKSQGGEFAVVIYASPCKIETLPEDMDFANRNLLYTGITRIKNRGEIVGSEASFNRCVQTVPAERNSHLRERLQFPI